MKRSSIDVGGSVGRYSCEYTNNDVEVMNAVTRALGHPRQPSFEYPYHGFTLRCRPQITPDGRFLAYVVILRGHDLKTLDALSPDLPSFADQADAIRAGLDAARNWVHHIAPT